jgi:hypothetical protein
MTIELNRSLNQFPEVIWVDANKRNGTLNLIFGSRIKGEATGLQIRLCQAQWENLKFLVDVAPQSK